MAGFRAARRKRRGRRAGLTERDAIAFVERHGVVLESARGPVPSLAEAVAGEAIRGSWWGHPKGQLIYQVLSAVRERPDVVVCRLVGGKVTYVHRRLWPPLVRLSSAFKRSDLAAIVETHTSSGAHRVRSVPYPTWLPPEVLKAGRTMSKRDAVEQLRPGLEPQVVKKELKREARPRVTKGSKKR